jgi:hypothetical protein
MKKKNKSVEAYEKLGLYIDDNDNFKFNISEQPTIEDFEKVIGEDITLVAECVLNTPEFFPQRIKINGEPHKTQREYFNSADKNYDGKKVDYIEKDKAWIDMDNEWLYLPAYDGRIAKIGMSIDSLVNRFGSYSCGTRRAMEKGSCSTTNFIITEINALAVMKGMNVEIYGIPVEKTMVKSYRFGVRKTIPLSAVREMETMLTTAFKNKYGKKPVLCVQEGK